MRDKYEPINPKDVWDFIKQKQDEGIEYAVCGDAIKGQTVRLIYLPTTEYFLVKHKKTNEEYAEEIFGTVEEAIARYEDLTN